MSTPTESEATQQHRQRVEDSALRTARSATVAAWAGALTSLCAVLISVYSAYLQRQQTRATFWPELSISFSDDPTPRLMLINNGVGPAILRWFQVRHAGTPVRNWHQLLDLTAAEPERGAELKAQGFTRADIDYSYSSVGVTRTIKAGEVVDMFVPWPRGLRPNDPNADPIRTLNLNLAALNLLRGNRKIEIDLCYCSIFDECTLALDSGDAKEVTQCPAAKPEDFTD